MYTCLLESVDFLNEYCEHEVKWNISFFLKNEKIQKKKKKKKKKLKIEIFNRKADYKIAIALDAHGNKYVVLFRYSFHTLH
jgi:uncharacterized protein (DUF2344 family)